MVLKEMMSYMYNEFGMPSIDTERIGQQQMFKLHCDLVCANIVPSESFEYYVNALISGFIHVDNFEKLENCGKLYALNLDNGIASASFHDIGDEPALAATIEYNYLYSPEEITRKLISQKRVSQYSEPSE